MIEKPKLLALLISISLTGLLSLYVYAINIEPRNMGITDIGEDDIGMVVSISGYVKDVDLSPIGMKINLTEPSDRTFINVFLSKDVYDGVDPITSRELRPGARIQLRGELRLYNEKIEIEIFRPEDVELLEKCTENTVPIPVLLDGRETYEGMFVNVSGIVVERENLSSAGGVWLVLLNESDYGRYSLLCVVYGLDEKFVCLGEKMCIAGTFEYYSRDGRWQVVCEDMTTIS